MENKIEVNKYIGFRYGTADGMDKGELLSHMEDIIDDLSKITTNKDKVKFSIEGDDDGSWSVQAYEKRIETDAELKARMNGIRFSKEARRRNYEKLKLEFDG